MDVLDMNREGMIPNGIVVFDTKKGNKLGIIEKLLLKESLPPPRADNNHCVE